MINTDSFKEFPILQTTRLILRAYTLSDAAFHLTLNSDEQVLKYLDKYPLNNIEEASKQITELLDGYERKQSIIWLIEEKVSGKPIGNVSFWKLDYKNSRSEIGYATLPQYWCQGYMSEVLQVVIDFGFKKLGLHSIVADTNVENKASQALVMKFGFKQEAYFTQNYYFDGQYLDSAIYCLVNKEGIYFS